jgi:Flp pilus assembly protein TadG
MRAKIQALIGHGWHSSKAGDFFRQETGSSLVEVAMILCFFCVPMMVGTAEMGLVVYDSIEVQNAAHTGAQYAMQSATAAADTEHIRTAAQGDAPTFGTALTVTPTVYYVCSAAINGTQYAGSNGLSNATSACTGGVNHPLQFVQVVATASVTPSLHNPGIARTFSVSSTSAMEVQQ